MIEAAKNLFLILSALFPIFDPLGGSPIFLAMTREYSTPVNNPRLGEQPTQ
jgi:multiple antibiotic resistance protein